MNLTMTRTGAWPASTTMVILLAMGTQSTRTPQSPINNNQHWTTRAVQKGKYIMIEIDICRWDDTLAQQALHSIARKSQICWVILFSGERWSHVEWVAVARDDKSIIGLASLAPTNEMGKFGPHIIGVWVGKGYRRQGIATQLVQALGRKSLNEYGIEPIIIAATLDGKHLVESFDQSVSVTSITIGALGNLE